MIAPRDWSHVHRVTHRRAAVVCALGIAACLAALGLLILGGRGQEASPTAGGVPRFLVDQLGSSGNGPHVVRRDGFSARLTAGGFTAAEGRARFSLTTSGTGRWHRYAHGALRKTAYGREAVVVGDASIEELRTVDRHLGKRTWRWKLGNLTLNPSLTPDGRVRFGASTLHLEPVKVLDARGGDVTPHASHWSLRRVGSTW